MALLNDFTAKLSEEVVGNEHNGGKVASDITVKRGKYLRELGSLPTLANSAREKFIKSFAFWSIFAKSKKLRKLIPHQLNDNINGLVALENAILLAEKEPENVGNLEKLVGLRKEFNAVTFDTRVLDTFIDATLEHKELPAVDKLSKRAVKVLTNIQQLDRATLQERYTYYKKASKVIVKWGFSPVYCDQEELELVVSQLSVFATIEEAKDDDKKSNPKEVERIVERIVDSQDDFDVSKVA